MAVLRVLELELRPLEIRSDSAYVVNGIRKHMKSWRKTNYRRRKGDMVNADLWRKLDMLLASRPPGSVELTKVKGHATADDVLQGRVSRLCMPPP